MILSRYFQDYLTKQVTDQAVQNYYLANAEDYQQQKAHIAHILVRSTRDDDETVRKVNQTKIKAAYDQLKTGKTFEDVAKDYSEDAVSSKKGGDLGWLRKGAIDQAFSDAAFALKQGTYSEPVETPFGYHIIKLIEGPNVVKRPLESVKGDIRYQLRAKAKEAEKKRLLAKSKVEKK